MVKINAKRVFTLLISVIVIVTVMCIGVWAVDVDSETAFKNAISNALTSQTTEIVVIKDFDLTESVSINNNKKVTITTKPGDPHVITASGISGGQMISISGADTDVTFAGNIIIDGNSTVSGVQGGDSATRCLTVNTGVKRVKLTDNAILRNGYRSGATGGAVYVEKGALVTMEKNSQIINCGQTSSGGAFYVAAKDANYAGGSIALNGGSIEGCTADNGGAIYAGAGTTVSINGVLIENCSSSKGSGGAVYLTGADATVNMSSGTIKDCSSKGSGGAIYGAANTKINISGGSIKGCSSTGTGGAIMVSALTTSASVKNCVIDGCKTTANAGGGAIYTKGNLDVESTTIKNCTTARTSSNSGGGAICIYWNEGAGDCTITNCGLYGNGDTNLGYGGGICAEGNGTLTIDGNDTCIAGNYAGGNGGGIYAGGSISLNIKGGTIGGTMIADAEGDSTGEKGNYAGGNGGGIYCSGTASSKGVTISGEVEIRYNKAVKNGGGLFVNSLSMTGGKVLYNEAITGGGVYIGDGQVKLSGSEISFNKAVKDNEGGNGYGGGFANRHQKNAVTSEEDSTVVLENVKILGNESARNGGGVWNCTAAGKMAKLKITGNDTLIAGNTAGAGGGGAFIERGILVMDDGVIGGNVSNDRGGGIYFGSNAEGAELTGGIVGGTETLGDGTPDITAKKGNSVTSKTASVYGGGIAIAKSDLSLSGVTIQYNATCDSGNESGGGGRYIGQPCTITGTTRIINNKGKGYGGGIVFNCGDVEDKELTIAGNQVEISNNEAGGAGGGIWTRNSVVINGGTFEGNKANGGSNGGFCKFYTAKASLEINDGKFKNNTVVASSGGSRGDGGVAVTETAGQTITVNDGEFTGNSAYNGGAFGATVADSILNVNGGNFTQNSAYNGGALAVSVSGAVLNISGGTFSENTVKNAGGSIYVGGGTCNLSDDPFWGTNGLWMSPSSSITKAGDFTWNGINQLRVSTSQANDGDVLVKGLTDGENPENNTEVTSEDFKKFNLGTTILGSDVSIEFDKTEKNIRLKKIDHEKTVRLNEDATLYAIEVAIDKANANDTIWMVADTNFPTTNSTINKSVTIKNAPGVKVIISATVPSESYLFQVSGKKTVEIIEDTTNGGSITFDGQNTMTRACYINGGSSLIVEGCTFTKFAGSTGVFGTGVSDDKASAKLTMTDSKIVDNATKAVQVGGSGVTVTLTGCVIARNNANDNGAAIHVTDDKTFTNVTVTLDNCEIYDNTSHRMGEEEGKTGNVPKAYAVIYLAAGTTCNITDCKIGGNKADFGGAIFTTQDPIINMTGTNVIGAFEAKDATKVKENQDPERDDAYGGAKGKNIVFSKQVTLNVEGTLKVDSIFMRGAPITLTGALTVDKTIDLYFEGTTTYDDGATIVEKAASGDEAKFTVKTAPSGKEPFLVFDGDKQAVKLSLGALSGITAVYNSGDTIKIGGDFDASKVTVTAIYSNGEQKLITEGFTLSGFDSDIAGTKTVTVTYGGKTADMEVLVANRDMLVQKFQLSLEDEADGSKKLRFISTVDTLDYNKVGFRITMNGIPLDRDSTKVYEKLYGFDGNTDADILIYDPSDFAENSKYFFAFNLKVSSSNFDKKITFQPFVICVDDTKIFGDERTISVNEAFELLKDPKVVSEEENN